MLSVSHMVLCSWWQVALRPIAFKGAWLCSWSHVSELDGLLEVKALGGISSGSPFSVSPDSAAHMVGTKLLESKMPKKQFFKIQLL